MQMWRLSNLQDWWNSHIQSEKEQLCLTDQTNGIDQTNKEIQTLADIQLFPLIIHLFIIFYAVVYFSLWDEAVAAQLLLLYVHKCDINL